MREAPIVTMEMLRRPEKFNQLLKNFPDQKADMLNQVTTLLLKHASSLRLEATQELLPNQLLTRNTLTQLAKTEDAFPKILLLRDFYPKNENRIMALIFHLDLFKMLINSADESVNKIALIHEIIKKFPNDKNYIAHLVSTPEMLKLLITKHHATKDINALVSLFPELGEEFRSQINKAANPHPQAKTVIYSQQEQRNNFFKPADKAVAATNIKTDENAQEKDSEPKNSA